MSNNNLQDSALLQLPRNINLHRRQSPYDSSYCNCCCVRSWKKNDPFKITRQEKYFHKAWTMEVY